MNFNKIRPSIDVEQMQASHAVIVGGAYMLGRNLVRCGLGSITLVDFDRVDATNPARQDFDSEDIGEYKTIALTADLKRINPDVEVEVVNRDFCEIDQVEFDELFGHTDLFILAADEFVAQARGNTEAQRLGKPALWIGLYTAGRAGEIIYHVPGVTPACYRCIASSRYAAFAAQAPGIHVPSDGGTIFDLHLVDAVAGQIAVGILTRGADNRMGRLIDQLGDRNLLQVKIDPEWRLGDRDIFAERFGDDPANFAFNTMALPMEQEADCPDCGRVHA